jgi:hypothetical protein
VILFGEDKSGSPSARGGIGFSEAGELYAFEVFWLDLDEDVLAVATESQLMFFSYLHMKIDRFRRTVFGAE